MIKTSNIDGYLERESLEVLETSVPREKNIGLCVLRTWMCFEVVLFHFWRGAGDLWFLKPFEMFKYIAVPTFMVMSFYLTKDLFIAKNTDVIKRRMWRITWPQIGWAIIYAIAYQSSISDLLSQALFGHSINRSMWYQFDLIVISAGLFLIFLLFSQKTALLVTLYGTIFVLFLEYSSKHFILYHLLPEELSIPLGRLVETFPMAIAGLLLAYTDALKKMQKNRTAWTVGAIALFLLVTFRKVFGEAGGFGYGGLTLVAQGALLLIAFFLFPFEKLPELLKTIIRIVSKHTLGIYCIHRLVQAFLPLAYRGNGFTDCILLYVVGWIVCEFLSRIPVKAIKQLVD